MNTLKKSCLSDQMVPAGDGKGWVYVFKGGPDDHLRVVMPYAGFAGLGGDGLSVYVADLDDENRLDFQTDEHFHHVDLIYRGTRDDLPERWAFALEHLDRVISLREAHDRLELESKTPG